MARLCINPNLYINDQNVDLNHIVYKIWTASLDADSLVNMEDVGIYAINNSYNNKGLPSVVGSNGGTFLVIRGNAGWGFQIYQQYNNPLNLFIRIFMDSGEVISNWNRISLTSI